MSASSSSIENLESGVSNFATKADLLALDSRLDILTNQNEIIMNLLASLSSNAQPKVQNARSTPPTTPAPHEFSTANSAMPNPSFTAVLDEIGVKPPLSPSTSSENSADNFVSNRLPRPSALPSFVHRDAVVSIPYKAFDKTLQDSPTTFKIFHHWEGFELHHTRNKVYDHKLLDSLSPELVNKLISDNREFLTADIIKKKSNDEVLGYLYKKASGNTSAQLRGALLIGIEYFYTKNVPISPSAHNTKDWLNQAVDYIDFFERYYTIVMAHRPVDLKVQMKGKIVTGGEEKEDTFYDLFFRMLPCKQLGNAIRTHFSNLEKMSEINPNGAPTKMLEVFPRTRNAILDDIDKLATVNYALLAIPSLPDSSRKSSAQASAQTPTHTNSFQHSRGTPYTNRGEENIRRPFRPSFIPNGARPNNGAFHGPRGQQATLANVTYHPHDERSHMTAEEFLLESVVSHDGSMHNPYAEDPDESKDEGFDADQELPEDLNLNALVRGQAQQDTSQLPCHSMALSIDKKCANLEAGKTCRYSHSTPLLTQYVKDISSKIRASPYFSASDSR